MKKINRNTFIYPMPVTLLGTIYKGKPNYMALGWITRINANPPKIAIGVFKEHETVESIKNNKEFSVNYPNSKQLLATDYCGLVSAENIDKSDIFTSFKGELIHAPMIQESTVAMECKLERTIELETNYLFIAEIISSYAKEEVLEDSRPDFKKMDPMLLTMPDNRYWSVGEYLGKAWNDGSAYRKQNENSSTISEQ